MIRRVAWVCLALVLYCFGFGQTPALNWVEDTFEDFADGRLDAGGQNLFVSREGKVRAIHRFDLNQDGYLDLVFNNNHDNKSFIPASLGTVTKDRRISQTPLAVEGSTRVKLADLNRDGYLDLLFCPNGSGVQTDRRFLTIIWGGEDGWAAHRSNGLLPVHGAASIAVVDLNRDGWPDIAVLNSEAWLPGQPSGRIIRIFWGSADGFLMDRSLELGVPHAIEIASADFDQDGSSDLAVLTSENTIQLLWAKGTADRTAVMDKSEVALPRDEYQCLVAADIDGDGRSDLVAGASRNVYIARGREGRAWNPIAAIHDAGASQISVGDLDGDKIPDLSVIGRPKNTSALANGERDRNEVRILWGDKDGFLASRSTALSVRSAVASAIGDLDGDGCADLALAVSHGSRTYVADSMVFFGSCTRRFEQESHGIHTEGASDAAIAPPEGKLPARVIFCNSQGGTLDESIPLQVYWGGPGGFDPARRLEIPFRSGYQSCAADLNSDGFVDLIAVNSGATSGVPETDPHLGASIFWGGASGIDPGKRTVLREPNAGSCNVADLNRDGYLDVVLGDYVSKGPQLGVVYYGSAGGFDTRHRVLLAAKDRPSEMSRGWIGPLTIADFNRDDWLDLAVTSSNTDDVRIFWGSEKGFDTNRQSRLLAPGPYGSETADLNRDGYLDLIVGTYNDYKQHHDTGALIFWGGAKGFHSWNAQWLPGLWVAGLTVADFDKDGYLDLFCSSYHAELSRESLPSYLYWGGPDGFATRRRTVLFADSVHDAFAGDFNQDGLLDLALSCHATDGGHTTFSKVFYNDGHRFADPKVTYLPTQGTHWLWVQDMGHIYDRSWKQIYESSVFHWEQAMEKGLVSSKAEVPGQSRLSFAIRASAKRDELERQQWREVGSDPFALESSARYLQYRATFHSDNGDRYPVLDRVSISLTPR